MNPFNLFGKKITTRNPATGLVDYGSNKKYGGHDHRYNTGDDRTPAQKDGDKKVCKAGKN